MPPDLLCVVKHLRCRLDILVRLRFDGQECPSYANLCLVYSLPRNRACIRRQQKHFRSTASAGTDHSLAKPELHLTRLKVGDADDQSADKIFRLVGRLDSSEDVASFPAAQRQSQLQQLVGTGHMIRLNDPRDTQVDFYEIIDGAFGG